MPYGTFVEICNLTHVHGGDKKVKKNYVKNTGKKSCRIWKNQIQKKSFRVHNKACLLVRLSVGGREQDHTWSTSWLTRRSSRLWLQAEKGRWKQNFSAYYFFKVPYIYIIFQR